MRNSWWGFLFLQSGRGVGFEESGNSGLSGYSPESLRNSSHFFYFKFGFWLFFSSEMLNLNLDLTLGFCGGFMVDEL